MIEVIDNSPTPPVAMQLRPYQPRHGYGGCKRRPRFGHPGRTGRSAGRGPRLCGLGGRPRQGGFVIPDHDCHGAQLCSVDGNG